MDCEKLVIGFKEFFSFFFFGVKEGHKLKEFRLSRETRTVRNVN